MQRRSSFMCFLYVIVMCCLMALNVSANTRGVVGTSEWDVTSFKVDLLNYQGANGDIQADQKGWIHLGANHLEGGDMTYLVRTGSLSRADILEVWIDGFSTSNALDIGPTVFVGTGKNRFEQITRMSGDAWRPFVFRFADDAVYGDVTDPSNRNENWRIRYPSSKYEVRRIDKAPNDLLDRQTLPIRVSITGAEDFIIKRIEVVVFRAQGGRGYNNRLSIVNLDQYRVYRGDRLTMQLSRNFSKKDVDFYIIDADGREHKIQTYTMGTDGKNVGVFAEGYPFSKTGRYQIKLVDRSDWNQTHGDSEGFEYVHPRAIAMKPKAAPIPKSPVSAYTPSYQPLPLPPIPPQAPPQYIVPVVPPGSTAGPPMGVPVPPVAPQGVGVVPVVQAGQYTIQIGAFRAQTSAVTMMNKLLKYGYDAYLSESVQGDIRVFRVRVGRYSSKALAHQMAARLKQSGFDTWITTQS